MSSAERPALGTTTNRISIGAGRKSLGGGAGRKSLGGAARRRSLGKAAVPRQSTAGARSGNRDPRDIKTPEFIRNAKEGIIRYLTEHSASALSLSPARALFASPARFRAPPRPAPASRPRARPSAVRGG